MREKIIRLLLKWLGIDERAIQQLQKKSEEQVILDKARPVTASYLAKLEREVEEIKQNPLAPLPLPIGKVYFVLNESANMVKIGFSYDPAKRLKELRTGSASEIKLLVAVDGGPEMEKALHHRFKDYRGDGEWFTYNKEIRSYIKDIKLQ